MKVNLLIDNPEGVKNGYLNIDPLAPENDPVRKQSDVSNLDSLVDDGEAVELYAEDIIDYFGPAFLDKMLVNWIRKLAHGGIIVVGGTDAYAIAKNFYLRYIDLDKYNELVYGLQTKQWNFKKSCITAEHLTHVLKSHDLHIINIRSYGHQYLIKAQRP